MTIKQLMRQQVQLWAKRGFSSLTGVFFAISVNTGEVLDYTVLAKACQKLVKSVPSKSHSVKGMTRSSLSGEESIWPLVSVTLTLMVVHQPWRRNELLSFGGDPLNYKKKHYKWMVSNGDRKAFKTFENLYMLDWKLLHWIVLAMPKRECGCTFWT